MDSNRPGELRLDISDFLCTLSSIKVTRMSLGFDKILSKVAFDLGADIKEIETTKGRLRLKYTLYVDANPAVERAEIRGDVTITSPAISAVTDLQALGEDKISDIALQIYRRNFEVLYLTLESAGLVAPSPWLIQDVRLVPGDAESTPEGLAQAPAMVPEKSPESAAPEIAPISR
ncbi:MAG TPA: hypothetical protein VEO75_06035 [Nitrososphaerales archaeon]|nr:hypothetical protein [Nitrososphaerales archaeon]